MQTYIDGKGPLILGGSGCVGRMLARVWPSGPAPLWQRRAGAAPISTKDLVWDILSEPVPDLPQSVNAVIVLAGVVSGEQLALNTALAKAGCQLAAQLGVRTLVASSQAVYGRQTGAMSEDSMPDPANAYGIAKYDMERALKGLSDVTCLRIGNVAGADGLFGAMARGPLALDQFEDGRAPRRMMIGPVDLARVLVGLCQASQPLPDLINVAAQNLVAMDKIADAAGAEWRWQRAGEMSLPELEMDVTRLAGLVPLAPATAPELVTQACSAGWQVAA